MTQAAPSRDALEELIEFFGCGSIIENNRRDNHRYRLMRYAVKRRSDLCGLIIPFFEEHPLRTVKQRDFESFRAVISMMTDERHLTHEGLMEIAGITETMNRKQRSRYLESSEAIRQPPPTRHGGEDMVRASWRHGGNSSEIPCRVSSDLHEWRNDLGTVSTRDSVKLQCE